MQEPAIYSFTSVEGTVRKGKIAMIVLIVERSLPIENHCQMQIVYDVTGTKNIKVVNQEELRSVIKNKMVDV